MKEFLTQLAQAVAIYAVALGAYWTLVK